MKTETRYDNPKVGCYVDASAQSADDCNRRTIELAEDYGFQPAKFDGCFDGLRGLYLTMTLDEAEGASHSGRCDEDVEALAAEPAIAAQLDAIGPEKLRLAMKECGAWNAEELADDQANRLRATWQAACDIRENRAELLSEYADSAVDYLNGLESRSFMSWVFEDNSLFLMADVDSAKDDVGFVSSKAQEYPEDEYRGEWLHISDHGNATLYVRGEDANDTEIWSVV